MESSDCRTYLLTSSLIRIESKHVCIINVWGYTQILPNKIHTFKAFTFKDKMKRSYEPASDALAAILHLLSDRLFLGL